MPVNYSVHKEQFEVEIVHPINILLDWTGNIMSYNIWVFASSHLRYSCKKKIP